MSRTRSTLLVLAVLSLSSSAWSQTGILDKIKSSGRITLGVRDTSIPLSYTVGGGEYVGFHVDVCQQIVANIRKAAGLDKLPVAYQLVTSQNRIPLVQNGTVDLECGSTTNNATRQKDVGFAYTTFIEEDRMAVRADSGIRSIQDVNGKTVGSTAGTTTVQHLRQLQRTPGVEFKELRGKDHTDTFQLLESGRADAIVNDSVMLAGLIASSKNPKGYVIVGDVLNTEPIAIMFRKDDADLRKIANETIRSMAASGALQALWTKWYERPIPPNNVTIGLPLPAVMKAAWAEPNDRPMEDYAAKRP